MSEMPVTAQIPHSPPTVLVVDAHYETRLMMRLCLEMSGLHVTEAEDGSEALRVAHDSLPDVITMEMWLPEVDGYEVCRRLREDQRTRLTPIVAVTSLGMPNEVERARDAAAFVACGSSPTAPANSATLSVMIKDSPYSDAKALLVTFSEVSAHASGGAWVTLPFAGATSRTCDLKKLAIAQDVLGTGPLSAGHYTEIQLTVATAALYFDNASVGTACAPSIAAPAGASAALDIPSGTIRLNRQFDLATGQTTTILVDFDGDKSVTQTGNGTYRMTPVIAIVSVQ